MKLKCIDIVERRKDGIKISLTLGKEYSSLSEYAGGYYLIDDTGKSSLYFKDRFEIMEEEFVLPETWHCIVTEENREILGKWRFDGEFPINFVAGALVGMFNWGKGRIQKEWNNRGEGIEGYGIELTTEQFIKYVLKQNKTEMKKIAYYEVVKEIPLSAHKIGAHMMPYGLAFEECAKYPEFFKPVYEEEYVKGDMVTDDNGKSVYTYSHFSGSQHYIQEYKLSLGRNARKATKQEIEKAAVIEFSNYQAGREGNKIAFGCKRFTKEELKAILRLFDVEINAKIEIGGKPVTANIIAKLIAKLS